MDAESHHVTHVWELESQAARHSGRHQPCVLGIRRSGQYGRTSLVTSGESWMAASIMGVLPSGWKKK